MAKSVSKNSNLLKFRERKSSITISSIPKEQNENQEPITKQYLRETGFNQLINEMIIYICQLYMEFNLMKRLIYYGILVLVGSILCDLSPNVIQAIAPYKSDKESFLNQYFVKIGWFWTLVLLIPFQSLTRKSIDNTIKWYDLKDLARIVIITLIWYFSISTFNFIEVNTGRCNQLSIKSRRECIKTGWNWVGFDISGHTFLLLFSNLILFEESKIINGFENFGYLLDNRNQQIKKLYNKNFEHYDQYHQLLLPVRVLYILMTFLALIWDFMLIQTILHYHNFLQKVIAFIWSVGCWYFCYRVLFPLDLFNLISMPLRTPSKLKENQ